MRGNQNCIESLVIFQFSAKNTTYSHGHIHHNGCTTKAFVFACGIFFEWATISIAATRKQDLVTLDIKQCLRVYYIDMIENAFFTLGGFKNDQVM